MIRYLHLQMSGLAAICIAWIFIINAFLCVVSIAGHVCFFFGITTFPFISSLPPVIPFDSNNFAGFVIDKYSVFSSLSYFKSSVYNTGCIDILFPAAGFFNSNRDIFHGWSNLRIDEHCTPGCFAEFSCLF